jgi:hypothetical protein
MNRIFRLLCFVVVAFLTSKAQAQSASEQIPVIQGGVGPCSIELKVLGADGKPAYAATVKVHIAYGFGGMHRLDLQAGTNSGGKVQFAELPHRVSRPPLEFRATKDDLEGVATFDPSSECHAQRDITLGKPKPLVGL